LAMLYDGMVCGGGRAKGRRASALGEKAKREESHVYS
jgi:hypothetical protein